MHVAAMIHPVTMRVCTLTNRTNESLPGQVGPANLQADHPGGSLTRSAGSSPITEAILGEASPRQRARD